MSSTVPTATPAAPTDGAAPPADAVPPVPKRFALLDVLEAIPLAPPLANAKQLLDRVANIRVDEDEIVLTGVWPRRIRWESVHRIEVCSRLDGLITLGLGFTPLGRIPKLVDLTESAVVGTLERVAGGPLGWARERAGWTVLRIHHRDRTTELRRLPAIVARLYPETTATILEAAAARDIEVRRIGCSDEGAGDA